MDGHDEAHAGCTLDGSDLVIRQSECVFGMVSGLAFSLDHQARIGFGVAEGDQQEQMARSLAHSTIKQ